MNDNETYTITVSEDVTLNLDSISINTGTYNIVDSTMNLSDITYRYNTAEDVTIDLSTEHWADGITWESIEFEDSMPSVAKVEDMCNDYPALEQAYEKFKTIYAMVHQDWKGKQDEEETPF